MVHTNEQIQTATDSAMYCFWTDIANSFPDITTGDLSPEQFAAFEYNCKLAVIGWINANDKQATTGSLP